VDVPISIATSFDVFHLDDTTDHGNAVVYREIYKNDEVVEEQA
jgi:hypothetical protein